MNETIEQLIQKGYGDDPELIAAAVDGGGRQVYLCVNGDIVTCVAADGLNKIFSDSVDRITDVRVSGLFKKKLCFCCGGRPYAFLLSGGKTLVSYFKQLVNNL